MPKARSPHATSLIALALLCAWPAAARADEPGLLLGATGSITFETSANSGMALSVGVSLSRTLTLTGEAGRLLNVLPASDRQTINAQALAAGAAFNGSPVVAGSLPATYGLVTIRARRPLTVGIRVYVEIGGGLAHLTNHYAARVGSADVSSNVLTTPLLTSLPATAPMLAAGAGVTLAPDAEMSVDVGYRLLRVLASAEALTTGQVYGAVHFRF
jgi:opacity protein-like surface antigen